MFPKFQAFTSYNEQLGQVPLTVVLTVFALPVTSLVFARFIGGTVCKDMATGMLLIKILQTHAAMVVNLWWDLLSMQETLYS